jgi:hypothetical protein
MSNTKLWTNMFAKHVLGIQEKSAQTKPKKTLQKEPKSLSSIPARRSRRPSPCRATLWGGAGDQVPAQQSREAERATKSLPSSLARRSGWPSPYRATLWGGADDQVLTEQPCKAEWATKSLPSNLVRQSEWTSPYRATLPERRATKSHASMTSVREGRPNDAIPHRWDKTDHHQSMPGSWVQRQKIPNGHQMTPRRVLSQGHPHWQIGPVNPNRRDLGIKASTVTDIPRNM